MKGRFSRCWKERISRVFELTNHCCPRRPKTLPPSVSNVLRARHLSSSKHSGRVIVLLRREERPVPKPPISSETQSKLRRKRKNSRIVRLPIPNILPLFLVVIRLRRVARLRPVREGRKRAEGLRERGEVRLEAADLGEGRVEGPGYGEVDVSLEGRKS